MLQYARNMLEHARHVTVYHIPKTYATAYQKQMLQYAKDMLQYARHVTEFQI
jgi:hypothetical protein